MQEFATTVIVGAGAMGCLFAARITLAGRDVVLVDVDRQRIEAINERGLLFTDDAGTKTIPVRACVAQELGGPVGLVIMFTKGQHTPAATQSVAHLAASRPLALSLQNGVGNAEILAEIFGPERTLFGTAHIPADLVPPNCIQTAGFSHLHLGGFTQEAHGHAKSVAALLRGAGFEAEVVADVARAVWEKLAFNAALNASAMICEKTNGGLNNTAGLRIAHAVVDEAVAVAKAKGINLDSQGIRASIASALDEHSEHKASMLQDREAGRATEIAMINGAIVREGATLGVVTPVCSTLSDLVRIIEQR